MSVLAARVDVVHVSIGQGVVGLGADVLEANLGSCVGVAMTWPEERKYGLVHILLPEHPGGVDTRWARYASTAPGWLLKRLRVPEDRLRELRVFVAGGAEMYGTSRLRVGQENITHARQAIRALRLKIYGEDTAGTVARRIRVECGSGLVHVVRMDDPAHPSTSTWSTR